MYPHEVKGLPHTGGHHEFVKGEGRTASHYESANYEFQEYPKELAPGLIVKSAEEEQAFRVIEAQGGKAEAVEIEQPAPVEPIAPAPTPVVKHK
jgi:hypothetical protein